MSPTRTESSPPASVSQTDSGVLAVRGAMTFHTAADLVDALDEVLRDGSTEITVDLSEVDGADSAAVALLVEWLRRTRARGRRLHFRNIPEQIEKIADISGVSDLLGSADG